ncbi:MAG: pyridoxine 5'-phosphate synthase, partial [Terrimicrobiaceae bacterium]|nr:pyridoxine 5'-phosphate synthase [Terrimicrobiaceae bacterium]
EILAIALEVRPRDACLVPENRQEITTEGGLDCAGGKAALAPVVGRLREAGIRVSLFIDPEMEQIEAAAALGAECVELHTGAYSNAAGPDVALEIARLEQGAARARELGLIVNAGHGLNYRNLAPILRIPGLHELNIGHSIISRAIMAGMENAVREMLALIRGEPLQFV